jgi:hypothetical protein
MMSTSHSNQRMLSGVWALGRMRSIRTKRWRVLWRSLPADFLALLAGLFPVGWLWKAADEIVM